MSLEELAADAAHRMDQAVEKVSADFQTIRTGRANPQVLHRVMVDYYGSQTPLQQLANFAVPEPRVLIVNPFDKDALNQIEQAIRDADLGMSPSSDGVVLRLVFPELTEERRKEYIKVAKQAAEEGRVAVRNVRRHARDGMQKLEDDGEVGKDEHERAAKALEELTAQHVARIDKALEAKEKELLEV